VTNPFANRIVGYVVKPASELTANPANWRKHPAKQRAAVQASLRELGWIAAVIENTRSGLLIDGHERVMQALAKNESVPVLQVDLSPEEEALALATFDPITYMAETDAAALDALLRQVNTGEESLQALLAEMADNAGLDYGKAEAVEDVEPQIDRAEELRQKWNVESGQMWQLGDHRLICGDCTDKAVVERVMGGERANVCLTDPPYGLGKGKESGKNNYDQHDDSRENLVILAKGWLPIARDLSLAVVFSPGVTNAWIYPEANWIMCWFYGGGQLQSSWGFNCWQPFLCYGKDPSLASGNGGRPDAINMNTPANSGDIDHPCPKPLELWRWFIERLSFVVGDIFYEPFSGSGTTLIACEQLGRRCRAVEISPAYVGVALERWATATGKTPVLID